MLDYFLLFKVFRIALSSSPWRSSASPWQQSTPGCVCPESSGTRGSDRSPKTPRRSSSRSVHQHSNAEALTSSRCSWAFLGKQCRWSLLTLIINSDFHFPKHSLLWSGCFRIYLWFFCLWLSLFLIRDVPIRSTASVRYWPITLDRLSEGRNKYDPIRAAQWGLPCLLTFELCSNLFIWFKPFNFSLVRCFNVFWIIGSHEQSASMYFFIIIIRSGVKQSIGLISVSTASQSCGIGIRSETVVSGHPYFWYFVSNESI